MKTTLFLLLALAAGCVGVRPPSPATPVPRPTRTTPAKVHCAVGATPLEYETLDPGLQVFVGGFSFTDTAGEYVHATAPCVVVFPPGP